MEKTLVMLKPDCIRRGLIGTFLTTLETNGLRISKLLQKKLSREEASELYKEHQGKYYFERNIRHVTSGNVVLLEIHGEDSVRRCRQIAESFRNNHKDVIRLPQNLVHATSDLEKAEEELRAVGFAELSVAV